MQDYHRALIVGDSQTYGKGTVQTVIDLGEHLQVPQPGKLGALKLTIQLFYRVNGHSTQARGVLSDVVVPSLTGQLVDGEKEQEHALPFDQVDPAEHNKVGLITPELKTALQERSAKRIKESKEFAGLARDIELLKERKARKKVSLNEKELRELNTRDEADKLDAKITEAMPSESRSGDSNYKFKRNFLNNEMLQIMEDLLQNSNKGK